MLEKTRDWFRDRSYDLYFWWEDRPFRQLWRAIKGRIDGIVFCLLLLLVAAWSPKQLRQIIIDSARGVK